MTLYCIKRFFLCLLIISVFSNELEDRSKLESNDWNTDDLDEDPSNNEALPGHLEPLGSNIVPLKVLERNDFPNPLEFFDDYVKLSKPVVMRDVAKIYPSFKRLSNDTYLRLKYGKWKVEVEQSKNESFNRFNYNTRLSKFLKIYKTEDVVLVSDMQHPKKITKEVYLPRCLMCADYLRGINSCAMWFSSGSTTSHIRREMDFEQFICQYDGKTTYKLANKNHAHLIKLNDDGFSKVDTERVNMTESPNLSKVPWYQVQLSPGDCLYIPFRWFYQSNTENFRNMRIKTFYHPIIELFSRKGCIKKMKKVPQKAPWSKLTAVHEDLANKKKLIALFVDVPQPFDKQAFYETILVNLQIGTHVDQQTIFKVFDEIDEDKNGLVRYLDVYKTEDDKLLPIFDLMHGVKQESLELLQQFHDEHKKTKKVKQKEEL